MYNQIVYYESLAKLKLSEKKTLQKMKRVYAKMLEDKD